MNNNTVTRRSIQNRARRGIVVLEYLVVAVAAPIAFGMLMSIVPVYR